MNTVLRTTEELCSEKFQNTDSLKKCIMTTVLFSNFVKQVIAIIELIFYFVGFSELYYQFVIFEYEERKE